MPGVSMMNGTPPRRGCRTRCPWRSIRDPSAARVSLRCTRASRSRPTSPSNAVSSPSIATVRETSIPAPQRWAVSRQKATRSRISGTSPAARAIAAHSATFTPIPQPPPDELSTATIEAGPRPGPAVAASSFASAASNARAIPSTRRAIPVSTPLPPCDPAWTFTIRAPKRRADSSSDASSSIERSRRTSSAPARLIRYEAWTTSGAMSRPSRTSRNAAISGEGSARRCQAVGLSQKTWRAVAPISAARAAAFTIPSPIGRWAPSRRPSGSMAAILAGGHLLGSPDDGPATRPGLAARRGAVAAPESRGEGRPVVLPRRPPHLDPRQAEQARPASAGDPRPLLSRRPLVRGEGGQHAAGAAPPGRRRAPPVSRRRGLDDARSRHLSPDATDGARSSAFRRLIRSGRLSRGRSRSVVAVRAARGAAAALRVLATDDRLDQPEVPVVAAVEDRDPLALGVDIDVEPVAEVLHPGDRVLLEHRLDGEALRLHDPPLAGRLRGPVREVAEDRLLLIGPGPDPVLLAMVD